METKFDIHQAMRALGDLFPTVVGLGKRKIDSTREGVFLSEQLVGNSHSATSVLATQEVADHYGRIAEMIETRTSDQS